MTEIEKDASLFTGFAVLCTILFFVFLWQTSPDSERRDLYRENLELSIEIKRKMLADSTYYNECVNLLRTMEK